MATLENRPPVAAGAPIAPPPDRLYRMTVDEAARIARVSTHGSWTIDDTEDYIAELFELVEDCRRRFGRVRLLVDRRESEIQSEPVVDRLMEVNAALFRVDDRLAVVVGSSLAKGQLRRAFVHAGSQAFLSHDAARLWLTAWP